MAALIAAASADAAASPGAPGQPQPEQQLKSLSLEQLGEVQVTTVSKEPEEVWHTPAAIYVLSQQDIQRSGATTIPELLRLIPGVQVSRSQSDAWAVGVRGFASGFSRGLLVLIDGRSVYTPLFEGVYWDVQDLLIEDIDRIELIRGPGGTIWGANAVNGVINIITKRSRDTQGELVTATSGQLNRFIGEAQVGFAPRRNVDVRVYAKGFNRGPEDNPGGSPYDHWHQERGGFRADWAPTTTDTVMVEGDIYQGQSGVEVAVAQYGPPPVQQVVDGYQDVSGGDLVARWDHQLTGGSGFYLQTYFDRTNRQTPQFGETRNTFDIDLIDHIASVPRNDVILGLGVRESPDYIVQTQPTVNFAPHYQLDYIYSGSAQDTYQIIPDRLAFTGGLKVDYNNFSKWEFQPNGRLLWNPSEHQSVWGAISRAVRTPGRLDQDLQLFGVAAPTPPFLVEILGNPKFRSEVMLGYEAGYRQLLNKKLYVDVAAFHNQYDSLSGYSSVFLTAPTTPYPHLQLNAEYGNVIRGVTDGFEIAPDWKPTDWWQLRGSYSHLHMALHDKQGFTDTGTIAGYVGSSPDRQFSFQSLFTLPHAVQIDEDVRYMSALPAQNVASYLTADAHLGWQMSHHFLLTAVGQNLLQSRHFEFVGDNSNPVGIRRAVFASITWTR